jgi:SAM-dependent methyltransferase
MSSSVDVIRASYRLAKGVSTVDETGACDGTALDPVARRLLADVPLRSRVLEIGCGTGVFTRELASKRGARITAIDVAPRMIDVARVRTRASLGIEYCVADFMELSPRGFEVAIAIDALQTLPLADAAARMAQAVVPGGLVVAASPGAATAAGRRRGQRARSARRPVAACDPRGAACSATWRRGASPSRLPVHGDLAQAGVASSRPRSGPIATFRRSHPARSRCNILTTAFDYIVAFTRVRA